MENRINNSTISEIIHKTGLSRAAFSREYHIPVRTLENWSSGISACPDYVLSLLERCVILNPAPLLNDNPLPLKELRNECGISRAALSREYNIPVQTLKNWESNTRKCPYYVSELLERCVRFDHLPVYFCLIHSKDSNKEGKMPDDIVRNWYISRSQQAYFLREKEVKMSRGFTDRHKCEVERNKIKKKLIPAERKGQRYEYFVMRLEEVLSVIKSEQNT